MSALSIQVPFPVFQDRDGQPLDNGYVWIGEPNLNPQTNPVVAYFDAALTITAVQPLRTLNGYISNAGTPAQVYVDGVNFSILVQDSKGSMVYNFPDGTGISAVIDSCDVTYDPPFTGGVAYPLCEVLEQTVSVKDFGAVGNGTTDDTAAIQLALNSGAKQVNFPDGTYLVSSTGTYAPVGGQTDGYCFTVPSNVTIQGTGIGSKILLNPILNRTSIFDVMGTAPAQLITTWQNGGVPGDAYENFILNAPDIGCVFTAGNSLDALGAGSATTNVLSVVAGRKYRVSFRLVQNFGTTPNELRRCSGTIASPTTIATYTPIAGTNEFEFTASNETHFVFTNSVGQQVNYTVYAFLLEDLTVPSTNRKTNITIDNFFFTCTGDQTAYLARARWTDNLTLTSNDCYGCGLLYVEQINVALEYNTIAMNGGVAALNQNWLIENNRIFGYDPTKTKVARNGPGMSIDGIFFTFTNNAKILNNQINDIHWGIYGNGGPGNPGPNGSDIKNTRYCVGAIISNNTVINGASGGIWWAMCDRFVVSNNWLSTIDDVGLEPEGSSNCLIEGNYCEHGASLMAQQRTAINLIWKNNHVFQDGLLRGYWLKQRSTVLFSDSIADDLDTNQRQLFLFGNTFRYEQGDILADETGRVAPNLTNITNIDSNTFINTRLDGLNSSMNGFSFTNNTLLFTGAYSGGASAVSPYTDPYRDANYSDVLIAVKVPNATSNGTYTPDIPVRVYNNRIDVSVTVPAGSIGIDIPLGASALNNAPYLLDFNRVSPKFAIGISFVGGGIFGTTFLFKNNTVESIRDYTWQYANDPNAVASTRPIYESNKKNDGLDLFANIPVVGKFQVPMQIWYLNPPGNYAGIKLITSGAAWKEIWSAVNPYVTGEQVKGSDGQVYIAIQNSTNQNPVTPSPLYWSLYSVTPAVWRQMALML
jgi:hypothetical protein